VEPSSSRYSVVPKFIRDRMREKKRREQERAVEQANRPAESSESRYSDEDRKALEEMSGEGFAKGGMVKKYAKGGMACGTKKYAMGGMVSKSMPGKAYAKGGMVSKVKPPGGRGTKSCKIC